MTLWLILGVSLAVVGGVVIVLLQMPDPAEKKMKKKDGLPPEPPKDWQAIAERVEKRLKAAEASLQSVQNEIKQRDKRIADLSAESAGIKKQFEHEKVWRLKEEAEVEKEKKQERLIQTELQKTREEVAREATNRIKQEAELKELRQVREEQTAQVRKLSSTNMDLDRKLNEAVKELKGLREENIVLKKKKEDEEWVAKTDYKKIEGFLKRARWEVEQFKRKFSTSEWPAPLQPKPAVPPAAPAPTAPVVPAAEAAAPVENSIPPSAVSDPVPDPAEGQ
ncbi:MAG: hypothetical protein HQL18_04200 [Candidatus Omnitrophica bacterium]|nr:hypothetical protein [Candidatus Omnitrophota bacterium]